MKKIHLIMFLFILISQCHSVNHMINNNHSYHIMNKKHSYLTI